MYHKSRHCSHIPASKHIIKQLWFDIDMLWFSSAGTIILVKYSIEWWSYPAMKNHAFSSSSNFHKMAPFSNIKCWTYTFSSWNWRHCTLFTSIKLPVNQMYELLFFKPNMFKFVSSIYLSLVKSISSLNKNFKKS